MVSGHDHAYTDHLPLGLDDGAPWTHRPFEPLGKGNVIIIRGPIRQSDAINMNPASNGIKGNYCSL
jgi:hypothetical protein